ncbi:hypothetical protein LJR290_005442 [Variovorax sp. LjRoot290]|uniref:hypothetical protein n=1 Tax=unclassified Variovorax TaxID=663243 RepID=UPI0008898446|nr:hypothetical protein [Variovorax sp. CF079]SDD75840.1 hypothetical protein SAMN05444679_113125 [Variovorax sp. CF079]
MSILQRSFVSSPAGARARALRTLAAEAGALVKALLNPNQVIEEVEQMRALHAAANRVEASNAARAAWLRSRASRIGLR